MAAVKVRCRRIYSAGRELSDHPRITIGREYVVTHIVCVPGHSAQLAILDDSWNGVDPPRRGESSQWEASMFETTSTRIPSSWAAAIDNDGVLAVAPPEWLVPGFWGDEYVEEPWPRERRLAAHETYRREAADIAREE